MKVYLRADECAQREVLEAPTQQAITTSSGTGSITANATRVGTRHQQ